MGGRIQLFFSIFLAVLAFAGISSRAEEELFCRNAYEAICEGETPSNGGESVEAFNRKAADEACHYTRVYPTEERTEHALLVFEGLIYRRLKVSRGDLEFFFEVTRSGLGKALEDLPEIPVSTRISMRKALARLKLMTASEYRTEFGAEIELELLFSCGFQHAGISGIADVNPGRDVVVLCPGAVSLLYEGFGGEARLRRLIAHELGHFINSDFYPATFSRLQTCLAGADPVAGEMFGEITADWWGIAALIDGFVKEKLSGPAVVEDFRSAFAGLCGGGDSSHPTGRYRIGTVLGTHPGVRSLAGCEEVVQADACTLRGPAHRKKLLGLF